MATALQIVPVSNEDGTLHGRSSPVPGIVTHPAIFFAVFLSSPTASSKRSRLLLCLQQTARVFPLL